MVDPIRAAPGDQRIEGPEEGVGLADGGEGAAGVADRHVGRAVLLTELGSDQAEQGPESLAPLADAVDDFSQVVVTLATELRQGFVDLRGRDPADPVTDGLVAFEREGQAQMLAGIMSVGQPAASEPESPVDPKGWMRLGQAGHVVVPRGPIAFHSSRCRRAPAGALAIPADDGVLVTHEAVFSHRVRRRGDDKRRSEETALVAGCSDDSAMPSQPRTPGARHILSDITRRSA